MIVETRCKTCGKEKSFSFDDEGEVIVELLDWLEIFFSRKNIKCNQCGEESSGQFFITDVLKDEDEFHGGEVIFYSRPNFP